jgi:kynurenine formamidase
MPTRDLSHPLDADTTVYPGDPAVELAPAATHADDGYRVTEVRLGSHSGTHLDAPSHTEPDGRNVDEFDVGEFAFDARLVDCSEVGAREGIGLGDLPSDFDVRDDFDSEDDSNTETDLIKDDPNTEDDRNTEDDPDAEMLVFRTGWDAHWGTDRYYDHPYLTRETAAWCADRGYYVALDALSPDPSPSQKNEESVEESAEESSEEFAADSVEDSPEEPDGVPAHRELLGSERFVIENLTGLGDLPEQFELRAYPLSLADSDGSPVRAVAVW